MKKIRRFRICEKHVMNSLKVDLGNVLDDPSTREFVCPYCSYSFAYKHVLDRHVAQIHEKHLLTTLQCPKCTYSTVRKDQMRAHFSVVHEDFKPFNCSECGFRAPKAFRVTVNIASFFYSCFVHPMFLSIGFWFFSRLAHLALQNVNKDCVIFS